MKTVIIYFTDPACTTLTGCKSDLQVAQTDRNATTHRGSVVSGHGQPGLQFDPEPSA